jgi:hypothetical protein
VQFFTANDFPRSGHQDFENKKRLLLQLDAYTLLAQFTSAQVDLEDSTLQK